MIQFADNDCVGCGACLEACKGEAFTPDDGYSMKFDNSKCVDCPDCYVEAACLGEAVIQIKEEPKTW